MYSTALSKSNNMLVLTAAKYSNMTLSLVLNSQNFYTPRRKKVIIIYSEIVYRPLILIPGDQI